jgi:signal transduction histidine kinase
LTAAAPGEGQQPYYSLLDQMLIGFACCQVLFDGDRPYDFIGLAVNKACEVLTGLKDVVGRRASEVVPGLSQSDPKVLEILGRVARTGVPEKVEMYLEALGVWFSAVLYSPRQDHFAAVFEVVSDRKLAEQQLRQREAELAHISRLNVVGELAGVLAHELKQPLHAINNYVRGAQRRLQKPNAPPGADALIEVMDQVAAEVGRATGIVEHVRDFVGPRVPRRTSVRIAQLLRRAAELLQPLARDKGVRLQVAAATDLPTIQADPIQIEQVIVNLATNAMEAVAGLPPERRRVTITSYRATDDAVEIAVRDRGPGIPAELGERVFEAFVTTKEGGLGMGLAISRSIVRSHGGKIWLVQRQPHGAAVHFILPLTAVPKEPKV